MRALVRAIERAEDLERIEAAGVPREVRHDLHAGQLRFVHLEPLSGV